jgi:hypothetical protein
MENHRLPGSRSDDGSVKEVIEPRGKQADRICIVPQVFNARRFGVDLSPYKRTPEIDATASESEAFATAEPGRQPDAEQNSDISLESTMHPNDTRLLIGARAGRRSAR